MTEKTRKRLIISTLPVAIVWALFNLEGDKAGAPTSTITTVAPKSNATSTSYESPITAGGLENLELSEWGGDPFRLKKFPTVTSPRTTTIRKGWSLSGILYNADNPVAIVNKRPVKVGQEIDGATVLNIDRNRIILEHDGKRQTLRVSKG